MEENNCRYGFKILETWNRGTPNDRKVTISDVMPLPPGTKDYVKCEHNELSGSLETLRAFDRREQAELVRRAEVFANDVDKKYGARAVELTRLCLCFLENYGLNNAAVARMLGVNNLTIDNTAEDRYERSSSRLLARLIYLLQMVREMSNNAVAFLSWGMHSEQRDAMLTIGFKPPRDIVMSDVDAILDLYGTMEENLPSLIANQRRTGAGDVYTIWDHKLVRDETAWLKKEKSWLFDTSMPRPDDET